ncbi:hypothetical protein D3876_10965 [Sphingomonas cavernae]|uniref:Membrane dipeptidase (Peptidase family M19) n=1 Tax=Sphingomonas cavernae TaxID=2320861 RepID=A0A418WL32_9SPHN|nr:hypothetical protein D3876_10965 [Sphingomonas cavernae]
MQVGILLTAVLCAGCDEKKTAKVEDPPLMGLADYHLHQFGFMGFGGTAFNHTNDPTAPCLPPLPFGNSLAVQDLVRLAMFKDASEQFQRGHCNPTGTSQASQRVDTDNLKRAWQYGLRLVVMFAVSSEFLCEAGGLTENCPSDRRAIEAQIQAAKALQDAIDTEAGGAGLGWYRIVTTPKEARDAITKGKLAVVLGIEAANAFGCRIESSSQVPSVRMVPSDTGTEKAYRNNCDSGYLTQEQFSGHAAADEDLSKFGKQSTHKALALFERYWQLGARHFYLTHNIDGIAGGTALGIDLLHSEGNPSGAYPGATVADKLPEVNRVIAGIRPPNTRQPCPTLFRYDGGKCNARGLSPEGQELTKVMAAHGAVIDADHVSYKARREMLGTADNSLLAGAYPLVSSHSGATRLFTCGDRTECNENNEGQLREEDIDAMIRTGGAFAPRLPPATRTVSEITWPEGATVAPHKCGGTTETFIQTYRFLVEKLRGGRLINGKPAFAGIGIGTDFGAPVPVFARGRFLRTNQTVTGGDFSYLLIETPPVYGSCYAESSSEPRLSYPFTSTSPLSLGVPFDKATTPWDGRPNQPGYDVGVDGVVHIGMIPDFVEEMRVLGLTKEEMDPLWYGAEAYIRAWEAAEAWMPGFDAEGKAGIREKCEADRARYLEAMDPGQVANAVTALRALLASACRGTPQPSA